MTNPHSRISLDLLRGFEAAARHLSFTLAAQELCLTQSAVSRQVKALEEQVGATLFIRGPRGLRLTPSGQDLLGTVSQAHELLDDAAERLGAATRTRELRVAAAVPFASLVIAPRIAQFLAAGQVAELRLLSTNEPQELDRVGAHVVVRHYRDGAAPAMAVRLVDDAVSPVCTPSLAASLAQPADLARHRLLRHQAVVEGRTRIDWIRWLQAHGLVGLRARGLTTFGQYDQVIEAARAGAGVALGRRPLLAQLLAGGELVEPWPAQAVPAGAWYALLASDAGAQPGALAFVEWLRAMFASARRPAVVRA